MFPHEPLASRYEDDSCLLILETEDELNEVLSVVFETTTRRLPEPA